MAHYKVKVQIHDKWIDKFNAENVQLCFSAAVNLKYNVVAYQTGKLEFASLNYTAL